MGPIVLAVQVLQELIAAPYGLTLQELARRLRRPMSSMQRVTRVMEDQRLVERCAVGNAFLLGPLTRTLAQRVVDGTTPDRPPVPDQRVLEQGVTRCAETVYLTRLIGAGTVRVVAVAHSPHPLRVCVPLGTGLPCVESASGRVLLAWLPRAEVLTVLAETSPFPDPAATRALFDRLTTIRGRDYDTGTDDLGADVWTVAAPIRPAPTIVTGSVTLAAPATRIATPVQRMRAIDTVLDAADALAAHHTPPPDPGVRADTDGENETT